MKKMAEKNCDKTEFKENPVMILNSVARLFDANVKAAAPPVHAISSQSCRFLMMSLAVRDGVSQLELCEKLHLSAPTVSIGLKKMEEKGFISRVPQKEDMRLYKVYLTEKGRAFDEENRRIMQSVDEKAMTGLTDAEKKTLTEILLKIRKNLLDEETIE